MKPRFRKRKSLAQGHPAGHGKYCQTLGHPRQDAREATKRPHRVGGVRAGRPVCKLSCATGLNSPEPSRSRNLRAPRPSPNGRAFYSEPPGQLLGSVPARAQPQARAGLSVHVFCHRAAWVPREVGAAVVPVWRWDREAPRDLVPWLRSPLSAGAGVGIYFLTSGLAS